MTTNQNGEFVVRARKDRLRRRFRVTVRFKTRPLTIFGKNKNALSQALATLSVANLNPGTAALEALPAHTGRAVLKPAKHQVHRDGSGVAREPGTVRLGTLQLPVGVATSHGEIWTLSQLLMTQLAQWGFTFSTRVGIKYPHHNKLLDVVAPNTMETPYANPINDVIYMIRNNTHDWMSPSFDPVQTLLHELMHVWAYSRSRGEVEVHPKTCT